MRRYEYHRDRVTRKWYWRRLAGGDIVADGGQGYSRKWSVRRAIKADAAGRPYYMLEVWT